MEKHDLNNLDPMHFPELAQLREQKIAESCAELPELPAVNRLANRLHPDHQQLIVREIITHSDQCKSYLLSSEDELAYFSAGQYLSVQVCVNGVTLSRPYSISSAPRQALAGFYRITVKAVPGGICSNYILNNWQVGTKVITSDPMGTFTYEPLRDAAHVVGIAGGSGITPFLSLAGAIADGDEDCYLTLLYCSRTADEILFRDELDALQHRCNRIKVVHVLSDEQRKGYAHGFASADLIRSYAPQGEYSVFACGPRQMYSYLAEQLPKLGLARKYIRQELHGEPLGRVQTDGSVTIRIICMGEERSITARKDCTILRSLEQNRILPPVRCRSGECGFCRSRLISGEIEMPPDTDHRRKADSKHGYIHPCCSFPKTDLVLEISKA